MVFTGIIQEKAQVSSIEKSIDFSSIRIEASSNFVEGIKIGASVSIDGVCLTVVQFTDNAVTFDVIPETLRVTNLDEVNKGSKVNLERSLKFGDEVGGHILSGHVSCKASAEIIKSEEETELIISCPPSPSSRPQPS